MKRTLYPFLLSAIVFSASAYSQVPTAKEAPANATSEMASPQKWEYAQLVTLPGIDNGIYINLQSSTTNVEANSYSEMIVTLGGKADAKTADLVHILNLLGSKGWELATMDLARDGKTFYFKRPIK